MAAIVPDHEEVLDLVDENDQVVGTITHDQVYDQTNLNGRYLRASNVFVVNTEGKVWVPKRLATKKIAPGGLDYSAGEHVMSGESYEAAAVRGVAEELNLITTTDALQLFFKAQPDPRIAPYFDANFLLYSDTVPNYSRDDYQSWEWLTPQELIEKIDAGAPAKRSLRPAAVRLLDYLAQRQRD